MKYMTEYRDGEKAKRLAEEISRIVTKPVSYTHLTLPTNREV